NDNGVILTAADGRNIVLDGTGANMSNYGLAEAATASITSGTVAGVYEGGFTLVASGDTRSIKIDGGYGTGTGDLENSGLARGEYSPATAVYTNEAKVQAAATSGTAAAVGAIKEGDLVINGVTIGASSAADDKSSSTIANSSDASASGIAIAAAINRSSEQTGVTATVNATEVVGTAGTTAATAATTATIFINGVEIGTVTSQNDLNKDRTATIDMINAKAGQTGVTAEDNGN